MQLFRSRHAFASLLLGVMVFWTLPRKVFHECATQRMYHAQEHDRSVQVDEHCPVCELAALPMLDDAQFVSYAFCTLLLSEVTCEGGSIPGAVLVESTGRGPPALV